MTPSTPGDTEQVLAEPAADEVGPPRWLKPLRDRVVNGRAGLLLWRIAVAVVGAAVVILGIVLLPLPGPGWAVIFGGLAIWATEFGWAQRLLGWAKSIVSSWTAWILARPMPIRVLIGIAALALLAGVFYLVWLVLY